YTPCETGCQTRCRPCLGRHLYVPPGDPQDPILVPGSAEGDDVGVSREAAALDSRMNHSRKPGSSTSSGARSFRATLRLRNSWAARSTTGLPRTTEAADGSPPRNHSVECGSRGPPRSTPGGP